MITHLKCDIFKSPATILVNPVNCVGVMGAGLAKQFKLRFPTMFEKYTQMCADETLKPGTPQSVVVHNTAACPEPVLRGVHIRIICLFPTKAHWKDKSEYKYIEDGVSWMNKWLQLGTGDPGVAIPPLGCGLGGLDRTQVYDIIKKGLNGIANPIYLVDK